MNESRRAPRALLALAGAAVLGTAAWGISALLFAPTLPVGTPAFGSAFPSAAAPAPTALPIDGTLAPYRLALPGPAWQRQPAPPAEGVVRDLHLAHAGGGAVMDVYLHRLPNEVLGAEDLANHLLEAIRANGPTDFTEVRREPIPGRPGGLLLHTRHRGSAGPVEELHGLFAQEGLGYHLDAIVDPQALPELRPDIEAVFRSFQLPRPAPPPSALPERPLALPAPPEPPSLFQGHDLRQVDSVSLFANARLAVAQGDHQAAVLFQHWAVAAGADGRYDLACHYSRMGQADAAFHWLQRAAAEEGVDPDWAARDPDLEHVRADPRWPTIHDHLVQVSRYWARSGKQETLLVLPKGHTPGKPLPIVVGMHGMGSQPADFAGPEVQRAADALSVAFVSASGTLPRGPHRFVWSESPALDATRVEQALADVADRVTPAPGQVILMGFSQGAQMAAEIAARRPDRYAGAILMSPGTALEIALGAVPASPELSRRRFVVVVGAGEHPGNVLLAERDARRLRELGADVFHAPYPDMKVHAFPPDFATALPTWIRFLLGTGPRP